MIDLTPKFNVLRSLSVFIRRF